MYFTAVPDSITAETIANATKTLKNKIVAQGENTKKLDNLLQRAWEGKIIVCGSICILQKETILKLIE